MFLHWVACSINRRHLVCPAVCVHVQVDKIIKFVFATRHVLPSWAVVCAFVVPLWTSVFKRVSLLAVLYLRPTILCLLLPTIYECNSIQPTPNSRKFFIIKFITIYYVSAFVYSPCQWSGTQNTPNSSLFKRKVHRERGSFSERARPDGIFKIFHTIEGEFVVTTMLVKTGDGEKMSNDKFALKVWKGLWRQPAHHLMFTARIGHWTLDIGIFLLFFFLTTQTLQMLMGILMQAKFAIAFRWVCKQMVYLKTLINCHK